MNKELENKILEDISKKKTQNDLGTAFITLGLSKDTKLAVQRAKRNYSMVYKSASEEKLFDSITRATVESLSAQLDFNVSDIRIVSRSSDTTSRVALLREMLSIKMDKLNFNGLIDSAMKRACIDGSVVTRTEEKDGEPHSYVLNMENLWFQSDDEDSQWFLERTVADRNDIPQEWEDIKESSDVTTFPNIGYPTSKGVEVYYYEGMCPLYYLTEDYSDTKRMWLKITATGLGGGQKRRIQDIQILGKDKKSSSYNHAQFFSEQGRFVGTGIPEILFDSQKISNSLLNNKYKRSKFSSLGLNVFNPQASGLTSDLVSALEVGGWIPTDDVNAVKAFPQQPIGNDLFNLSQEVKSDANRLTGSTEISRGQRDRAQTATQVNAETSFTNKRLLYAQQNIIRLMEEVTKKWAKIVIDNMKAEEIIMVSDEVLLSDLAKEWARVQFSETLRKNFEKLGVKGFLAATERFNEEQFFTEAKFNKEWKLRKSIAKNLDYEVRVTINDSKFDTQAFGANLIQMLNSDAANELDRGMIKEKLFEMYGINYKQYLAKNKPLGPQGVIFPEQNIQGRVQF